MGYECTGELREFNSPAMRVNSQLVWDSYLLRLFKLLVSVLYLWARTTYTTGLISNYATHFKVIFLSF